MRPVWHNDNEPFCCEVLRKNFPDDVIDERSICDIQPEDLDGYDECHFFSGIGGFRLGLQWAGWTGPIWTGGFPCQDISCAGKGEGLSGERSGLWWEWLRLIRARRPVRLLIENVPALRTRGADAVLASLEELGYTCRPILVGAWCAGANHRRTRVWFVAQHAHGGNVETVNSLSETGTNPSRINRRGWQVEPNMGRVADGIPRRVDRLRGLGNAVVPQVVEAIARAWMKTDET